MLFLGLWSFCLRIFSQAADWAECMVQFGDGSYDAEEARSKKQILRIEISMGFQAAQKDVRMQDAPGCFCNFLFFVLHSNNWKIASEVWVFRRKDFDVWILDELSLLRSFQGINLCPRCLPCPLHLTASNCISFLLLVDCRMGTKIRRC